MKDYTFEDFKSLVEKAYQSTKDPMSVPFGMDPYSSDAALYRRWKAEAYNYVLEMMPDSFDIARHSKRLVEQQRQRIAELEHRLEGLEK